MSEDWAEKRAVLVVRVQALASEFEAIAREARELADRAAALGGPEDAEGTGNPRPGSWAQNVAAPARPVTRSPGAPVIEAREIC
jgi:hypothetical protein